MSTESNQYVMNNTLNTTGTPQPINYRWKQSNVDNQKLAGKQVNTDLNHNRRDRSLRHECV